MKNYYRYNFEDFIFSNYKIILNIAKLNYKFANFTDDFEKATGKVIIWRHDLEFSVANALKMAEYEAELNISATYFLQLHSEFYNILDKNSFNSIIKIMNLGHNIGLHFDSHFWNIETEDNLEKFLEFDKTVLEKYFGIDIKVFSFHNTNSFILSCEKDKYADMINVYSKYFKKNFGYCTDSTGFWRYERLIDRLKEAKDNRLQVLIHDGMWQDVPMSPRKRIFKVINDNAENLKCFYDKVLKDFNAKNIDDDDIL